jgi:hypothetical protein
MVSGRSHPARTQYELSHCFLDDLPRMKCSENAREDGRSVFPILDMKISLFCLTICICTGERRTPTSHMTLQTIERSP